MELDKNTQSDENNTATSGSIDTPLTQRGGGRSRPVQYEVVSRLGNISPVKFSTAQAAGEYARECFPDQEQDEERTGKGWDVQVVGCDR